MHHLLNALFLVSSVHKLLTFITPFVSNLNLSQHDKQQEKLY